jgi:hypothetical protein
VMGGNAGNAYYSTVEFLTISTGTWSAANSMIRQRASFGAALTNGTPWRCLHARARVAGDAYPNKKFLDAARRDAVRFRRLNQPDGGPVVGDERSRAPPFGNRNVVRDGRDDQPAGPSHQRALHRRVATAAYALTVRTDGESAHQAASGSVSG